MVMSRVLGNGIRAVDSMADSPLAPPAIVTLAIQCTAMRPGQRPSAGRTKRALANLCKQAARDSRSSSPNRPRPNAVLPPPSSAVAQVVHEKAQAAKAEASRHLAARQAPVQPVRLPAPSAAVLREHRRSSRIEPVGVSAPHAAHVQRGSRDGGGKEECISSTTAALARGWLASQGRTTEEASARRLRKLEHREQSLLQRAASSLAEPSISTGLGVQTFNAGAIGNSNGSFRVRI